MDYDQVIGRFAYWVETTFTAHIVPTQQDAWRALRALEGLEKAISAAKRHLEARDPRDPSRYPDDRRRRLLGRG